MLKRIDVVDVGELSGDNTRHLTIFYTGLYRALTFPRRLGEYELESDVWSGPLTTFLGVLCLQCVR